jgi:glutamyl-tRNA synthetase
MGITHVIRGEEHLPNTPKQILLYKACGFVLPQFAHLSLILGPDGSKLSKRDAATSVIDYKLNGFLADALCNYLVRLGWAHGDQEIFTRDELIRLFTLDEVGKKGAIFDIKKLEWMNGVFIRESTPHELERLIVRDIDPQFRSKLKDLNDESVYSYIRIYQDRVKTLVELKDVVISLYEGPTADELKALGSYPVAAKEYSEQCLKEVEHTQNLDRQQSDQLIKKVCAHYNIKMPELAQPLRIALTGKLSSPGVYDIFATLGRDTIIKRLRTALAIWEHL